jgi:hypothetical protein
MRTKTYVGLLVGTVIAISISSCAGVKPKLSSELQSELDAPLYCENEQECKTMWERATYFVNANAGFKLQVLNDTIIETYNPSRYSPRLAFSISKEPLGDGRYQIWTKAWCANIFGCQPNQYEAIARLKRYMRTGKK